MGLKVQRCFRFTSPVRASPKGGPFEGLGIVHRNGRSRRSGQMETVVVSTWSVCGQHTVNVRTRSAYCLHVVNIESAYDCTWSTHGQHTACMQSAHGQHAVSMRPAYGQHTVSIRSAYVRIRSTYDLDTAIMQKNPMEIGDKRKPPLCQDLAWRGRLARVQHDRVGPVMQSQGAARSASPAEQSWCAAQMGWLCKGGHC